MEIVINDEYGGFSLSPRATKRLAELSGRKCYFFVNPEHPKINLRKHIRATQADAQKALLWYAYDIPNPDEVIPSQNEWHSMSDAEKKESSRLYQEHSVSNRPDNRADPKLIQVVKELGKKANGACAHLKIVEIPEGIEWTVEEYDGLEWIAEKHRTWE